jgi:hypothetical protein
MPNTRKSAPRWPTSAFGGPAEQSATELSELGNHLLACDGQRGRLFALKTFADTLERFALSRFISILVVVTLIGAVVGLMS